MGRSERIPSVDGMRAAIKVFPEHHEGTNLTDRMGLAGVCLVFPELRPVASDMQLVMTLAHGIDHVYDEGDTFRRITTGPTNLQNINCLYHTFYNKFGESRVYSDVFANTVGFLSQAGRIERCAHETPPQSPKAAQSYRELINAVYVRMMISFGSCLMAPDQAYDTVGVAAAQNSPEELMEIYSPFINGDDLEEIPNGDRAYALFLWTMVIQEQSDQISASDNLSKGVPFLSSHGGDYRKKAIEQGVRPEFMACAQLGFSALVRSKRALRGILPRYKNEREILQKHK